MRKPSLTCRQTFAHGTPNRLLFSCAQKIPSWPFSIRSIVLARNSVCYCLLPAAFFWKALWHFGCSCHLSRAQDESLLFTLTRTKNRPRYRHLVKNFFCAFKRDNRSVLLQTLLRWALWVTCHAYKTVDTTDCYRPILFFLHVRLISNFQYNHTFNTTTPFNSTQQYYLMYTFLAFTDSTFSFFHW